MPLAEEVSHTLKQKRTASMQKRLERTSQLKVSFGAQENNLFYSWIMEWGDGGKIRMRNHMSQC